MNFMAQPSELSRSQHLEGAERVIPIGDALISATLSAPLRPRGVVVLLHASSAGRFEQRNRFAGQVFDQADLATLQVDLLTPGEEAARGNGGDLARENKLMTERALAAVEWLQSEPTTAGLPVGLLASTSETVSAINAAERSSRIVALVSEGGCPRCPEELPSNLRTPTLLLLGEYERARAAELASEYFARHFLDQ